jgi:hypothetical protein
MTFGRLFEADLQPWESSPCTWLLKVMGDMECQRPALQENLLTECSLNFYCLFSTSSAVWELSSGTKSSPFSRFQRQILKRNSCTLHAK